ncbi:vitamin K epoxide reductase family protein [Flavobacterium tiangeerense]|uniref:vitamin K epoxide reductase family protein n=1 Tax=Flavobacterium tiangeerense TaxID=459471 RepID=UPI0011AAF875|nr:vitamin K epoxide reductase family protein [Flavobacterium tiangeerense]
MDIFYKKLKVSQDEFLFQFQSHPNYPSVLSFSDTLTFLGFKNEVYEIEKEFWLELPQKFITIYENKYTIVEGLDDNYLVSNDKVEKISTDKLYNDSENIVLLFDDNEENEYSTDRLTINNKWFIRFLMSLIIGYSFFTHSHVLFVFNIFSIFGLYVSLELFKTKFGRKSAVINSICTGSGKVSETNNSCTKIFKSDKINFIGLKLSDFSLVYFFGLLFVGLFIRENYFILKYLSFLSGIVICYSLYIQLFIEKTFCKICLLIIVTLLCQMIVSIFFINIIVSVDVLFISVFSFLVIFSLVAYINSILDEKEKNHILNVKNIRFKKNYSIFKRELQEKKYNFHIKNDEFRFGSKDSRLNISLITNPYCGYCAEIYKIIRKIIKRYPDISLQLRFSYLPINADHNLTLLITIFRNIYTKKGADFFLEAIEFWHDRNDIEIFLNEYSQFTLETEMDGIIDLAEENISFGLTYTPQILINNYLFPVLYERNDIFYFLDNLIEDEDILNECN